MSDFSIYISHAWGGESEKIVQEIYKRCRKAGLNILLDKKDLRYRESISSFMKNLGMADAIILVVSNKYLHSEYCMYELLQIYENKNILNRIFPVVLDEVSIAKSTERLGLVKYWENETEDLEARIRELKNLSYIEGITEDLNLYQKIRNNIANLTRILKDINTLNIKLHEENDFNDLIQAIENYIIRYKKEDYQDKVPAVNSELAMGKDDDKSRTTGAVKTNEGNVHSPRSWWSALFRTWPLLLLIGLVAAAVYLWYTNGMSEEADASQVFNDQTELQPNRPDQTIVELSDEISSSQTATDEHIEIPSVAIQEQKPPEERPSVLADHKYVPSKPGRKQNEIKEYGKEPEVPTDIKLHESVSPVENNGEQTDGQKHSTVASIGRESDEESEDEPPSRPSLRVEEVYVPATVISALITQKLSSNRVKEGDVIYLQSAKPIFVEGVKVTQANARIKARVIDAKASHQGGRAALGIRLEGLETVDGQWLDVNYHDIVERKRGEIVFHEGTLLNEVKIQATTINLKIIQ